MKINFPVAVLFFLAVVSVAHASFDVSIISESHDIIEHEAIFLVKNLANVNTDFYISTIINETDINAYDIKFYEWKAVPTEIPLYSTETITNEYSLYNGTLPDGCTWIIEDVSYSCSFTRTYQSGTQEVDILAWKSCKQNLFTESANSIRSDYDAILIPKSTSKPSYDYYGTSYGADGEKIFRLTWKMPIINYGDRFGSAGYYAFYGNNISYDPFWNTSWYNRIPINISTSANYDTYTLKLVVANYTGTDYSDYRFVNKNNNDTLNFWIESYNSTNATIWVNLTNITSDNGTQAYLYVNGTTGIDLSNGTNTFIFFDDFSTNTTGNYKIVGNGNIFYNSTCGCMMQTLTATTQYWIVFNNLDFIPTTYSFQANIRITDDGGNKHCGIGTDMQNASTVDGFRLSHWQSTFYFDLWSGGNPYNADAFDDEGLGDYFATSWITMKADRNRTSGYLNFSAWNSTTLVSKNYTFTNKTNGTIGFHSYNAKEYIDNVIVRTWINPEPTYILGSLESQESISGSIFVNITSPLNNTEVTTSSPTIIFNVTGNETSYSCTAYINSTAIGTNASCSNATNTTITSNISVSNGIYNITVNCSADWGSNLSGYHNISVNNSWLSFGSTGQNVSYIHPSQSINLFSFINSSSKFTDIWIETNQTGVWANESSMYSSNGSSLSIFETNFTYDANVDVNPTNANDRNWDTYAESTVDGDWYVYYNYSLENYTGNISANITAKHYVGSGTNFVGYYGIGDTIKFGGLIHKDSFFHTGSENCGYSTIGIYYNVSSWNNFRIYSCYFGTSSKPFYEANATISDYVNLSNTYQNVTFYWSNTSITGSKNVSWRMNASNTDGSVNVTTTGSFIIDGTNPTILNVTVPYGGGIVYGGAEQLSNFTANVSDDASGLSAVYCEVEGSNHTASNISDIWYCELRGLTPDTYQISFWAVDNVGNINHSDNSSYIVVYSETYGVGDSGGGGGGGAWYMPPTTTTLSGNQTGTSMPEIPITARVETMFILGSIIFFIIYRMQKKKSKRIKTI